MFEVKPELTIENILNRVDDFQIFRNYCSNFSNVNTMFPSEFRKEQNNSAVITYYNNKLWYKDFGDIENSAMDCFTFIMKKYGMTFREALGTINNDFNLGLRQDALVPSLNYVGLPDKVSREFEERKQKNIRVKVREWNKNDLAYWSEFNINLNILQDYYVQPISRIFMDFNSFDADEYHYSYYFGKNNNFYFYKLYSPFGKYKWLSNCKKDLLQGFSQLPLYNDNLIITKSLKDVMTLSSYGVFSIAPGSESQLINYNALQSLYSRFRTIYINFDNDDAGIKGSKAYVEHYNLKELFVPKESGCKDISDYRKIHGHEKTINLIKNEWNIHTI